MKPIVPRLAAAVLSMLPLGVVAHGPTPHKIDESIEIARPPAEVWAKIADFGAVATWNPSLAGSKAPKGNAAGSEREITLKSGGVLVESLDEYDASKMTYSYRLLRENVEVFPVSFYSASISVQPAGTGSKVEWTGAYYRGDTQNDPPENLGDAAAEKAMTEFYRSGLEGLRRAVEK
jgi:mxaD protein